VSPLYILSHFDSFVKRYSLVRYLNCANIKLCMTKKLPKKTKEKEVAPKVELNLPELLENAKELLPVLMPEEEKEITDFCEVHIVGTPEMIQKILKID